MIVENIGVNHDFNFQGEGLSANFAGAGTNLNFGGDDMSGYGCSDGGPARHQR